MERGFQKIPLLKKCVLYLFIFWSTGSSLLHVLFFNFGQWGLLSSCGVWISHWGGFSACRAQARARGLSSCGSQVLDTGSVVVEHRLSCSEMWNLPRSGIRQTSPAVAGRFFTEPPRNTPKILFCLKIVLSCLLVVVIQSLSCVRLFVAPWTAECCSVAHHILEFAQTHVHWIGDAIETMSSSVVPTVQKKWKVDCDYCRLCLFIVALGKAMKECKYMFSSPAMQFGWWSRRQRPQRSHLDFNWEVKRSEGEGNGSPLQYSCLEYPMDRGAQ